VFAALFHPLLAAVQHESAAEQGKKVVLLMLATGGVFIGVIALGELAHWAGKQRARRRSD
jgi:hypothetical protein